MEKRFVECEETFDALRARYVERKHKPHEFELFVHFEEYTVRHWALRQQVHHGDITAPKENYMDEDELSWMWSWIKGNQKWHAWSSLRGTTKTDAMFLFIEAVKELKDALPTLDNEWRAEFLHP